MNTTSIADYSLIRLFDTSGEFIVRHIMQLNDHDRYLRFGYSPSEERITEYVVNSLETVNTRTNADFWFGIKLQGEIVATLHVAIRDDLAEFAFTTAAEHRGKGLGQLLFGRGYQLVTEYSITRIYMMCLSENAAMRHIASKFGLAVMTQGPDAESSITVKYPVSLKQVETVKHSFIDKSLFT